MRSLVLLACCLPSLVGCSWSRFEDVSADTPVVLLKKPDSAIGFGVSLATARTGSNAQLLVGGGPGFANASMFDLGLADQPVLDAVDVGSCRQGDAPCAIARNTAGLGVAAIPGGVGELCYVFGVGASNLGAQGLLARCNDDTEYALTSVPDAFLNGVVLPTISQGEPGRVVLAADASVAPAVVAGAPTVTSAWFYWERSLTHQPLVPPGATRDPSYGAAVASVRLGQGRAFAVSAPEVGHVWLFRSRDGVEVELLGCLGQGRGFGRTLAAGPVVGGVDDLVIAGESSVLVISGQALGGMPAVTDAECSLSALPAGALLASFTCGQTPDVESCLDGEFGATMVVGDFDGDGDGEVAVGAPGMAARGVARAGAVLVYDAEGDRPFDLSYVKFLSSAEEGDQLGASLAAPAIEGRNVLAAGAPGNGKTALFYCSDLVPEGRRGSRCR